MIIKTNEDIFILPDKGLHLLICEPYTQKIIQCFSTFLIQKKKTHCLILDSNNEMIDFKSAAFIYISAEESVETWFDFKPKTLLNNEISTFITHNEDMFETVQTIREDLQELLTDKGFYEIYRILKKDLSIKLDIEKTGFEISKLLQMFSIDIQDYHKNQQLMILYNLLIFVNRDKFRVIYIDFEINDTVYSWLLSKKDSNALILVNNESVNG